jgi:ABC-type branched-subunit amino acid transport system ATPase component
MASPVIELHGVCKAFGEHRVIKELSLSVPAPGIFGFLGNNGEGKSTTIRLITGLLRPDRGDISVLGMDVRTQRRAILAQVGVIVDAACFYPNLTAAEFLRIGCEFKGLARSEIGRVLELVSLGPARDRLVGKFSLGMKQRLAIAHALLGAPKLLILDEPFMLPLYIALVTGLLNGQEHKNGTWRLMLTLPISQRHLYVAKAVLAWLFVTGANVVLVAATSLAVGLLGLAGAALTGAFAAPMLAMLSKISLACIPVLLIQHAVSWRVRNLVLPLAVGVIATMGIAQVGSSTYWAWYPWTYPLVAANGSDTAMQSHALLLAAGLGAALFAVTALVLGGRETET